MVARQVVSVGLPGLLLLACQIPTRNAPQRVIPKIMPSNDLFFYPPDAYEKQVEGTVVLLIYIEKSGYVGKTEIFKTSGSDILDNAALAMARTVQFMPGTIRGEPLDIWMIWPVVFDLTSTPTHSLDLMEWQRKALAYQSTASSENAPSSRIAQQNLFSHYLHLASKVADNRSIIPNRIIMKIIVSPLRAPWSQYQEIWPLGFVLFLDYTTRFPDSQYIEKANDHLLDYITNEIALLKGATTDDSPWAQARGQLLNDLTRFFEEQYPGYMEKNLTN